jgi:hypothetical protein
MATGRTTGNNVRAYVDGYDLSGDVTSVGELTTLFQDDAVAGLNWGVKGTVLGRSTANVGPLNAILNSTALTGIHALTAFQTPAARNVMIPIGIRAAPALGDPVFSGVFEQLKYGSTPGDNIAGVSMEFGSMDSSAGLNYANQWGALLHPLGLESAANSANGVADDLGVQTLFGGWMMYQITAFAGTGSVVIKIQDATTIGGAYTDVTGLATGSIAHTSMPTAGIIQIGTTATVRAFTRWQIVLTSLTSVTFALAFIRGRGI